MARRALQRAGGLRRARREPRGGGCARGLRGVGRVGARRALPVVAALAVPRVADARLPRGVGGRRAPGAGRGARGRGWFGRGDLRGGSVLLPPRQAIARSLIDEWVVDEAVRPGGSADA